MEYGHCGVHVVETILFMDFVKYIISEPTVGYKSQGRVCMYYFMTFLCILESCVFGPRLKFIFVFLK